MEIEKPHINPYLFERQLEAFKRFVEQKSGLNFVSFASHPYIEEQENYKGEIYRVGRNALAFKTWKQSNVGNGDIIDAVLKAIEMRDNNLVRWQDRHGIDRRPQQPLYEARDHTDKCQKIEESLFTLYRNEQDEQSFAELVSFFGRTYPLLAYLFFLKDRSKYLPIAPRYFDKAFNHLGAEFKTSHKCSWENYSIYIALISELKAMLADSLDGEVTLLDAHSFAWILASQMESEKKLADVQEYQNLPSTDREAIVKARVGQGRFRQSLITYWSVCAVTGCSEVGLLRASHIKPWAKATLEERLSVFNGLLLSPTLDACFDAGFISFENDGRIRISDRLKMEDICTLGIDSDMRLKRVETEHKKYLEFHREHIFKR